MDRIAVLILAACLLGFGLASRRIESSVLTGPMLFTAIGFLTGPAALDWMSLQLSHSTLHLLAEATLVMVLFSDAASIDLKLLLRDHNLPLRMLLAGMPLVMAAGTGLGLLIFPSFGVWEAALLAAILSPTDAALGKAVLSDTAVPLRIRTALNVESGLNDGIALPFVLFFGALASVSGSASGMQYWVLFAVRQIGVGLAVGAAMGWTGGRLVAGSYRLGWLRESSEGMIAIAAAVGTYGLAELVGGNGFVAAFTAGLAFGNTLARKCRFLYEFAESEGQLLILLTFAAFGNAMLPSALDHMGLMSLAFAAAALTLMRMLPAAVALAGTGIRLISTGFLGWFGPKGLASLLFALLVLEEVRVPHEQTVYAAVVATVLLSVFCHGLSAGPLAARYGNRISGARAGEEHRAVSPEPFPE